VVDAHHSFYHNTPFYRVRENTTNQWKDKEGHTIEEVLKVSLECFNPESSCMISVNESINGRIPICSTKNPK